MLFLFLRLVYFVINLGNFISGVLAYDTCGKPAVARRKLVDYIRSRDENSDDSGQICPAAIMYPGGSILSV